MPTTTATLSTIAEAWIQLDGKPFRLDDWGPHRAFYDGRHRRTLFKTSRQVAKSTTLCNFSIIECALIPHFSTMFVSPTKEQTVRFSTTRVGKTMRYSPIIKQLFLTTDLADRVLHKQFTNGSEMLFAYGTDDADRLRGPSTDRNMYDEIQDLLYDPIITVGNETMSNSDHAFETYAGTPKTMENTIQYLWDLSTQTEWVMQCEGCKVHQFIDSEKAIGLLGPICIKCGHRLNPRKGTWIDMNPIKPGSGEDADTKLKGFHLSQLIMPQNVPLAMECYGDQHKMDVAKFRWNRILKKHRESPPTTFKNEVLGVSDAIGARMISKEELEALCVPGVIITPRPSGAEFTGITRCVAGVDWSGGGTTGVSRTVLWVWGHARQEDKLYLKYFEIFEGRNPVHIIDEIAALCTNWRVEMIVGDAGEGHTANSLLQNKYGRHRVLQLQYGSQALAIKWNDIDRYIADRTTLIDAFFLLLKRGGASFADPSIMHKPIEDMLAVFEHVTNAGKKIWQRHPTKPDDCLHAALFGWVASRIVENNLDFIR